MGARIPFGYRIVEGKAVIDEENLKKLKRFFSLYLEGTSMAEAARTAELPVSASTLPKLLRKKVYLGTDYYPPVLTYDEFVIRYLESVTVRENGFSVRLKAGLVLEVAES